MLISVTNTINSVVATKCKSDVGSAIMHGATVTKSIQFLTKQIKFHVLKSFAIRDVQINCY